jgi:hypothetical protein
MHSTARLADAATLVAPAAAGLFMMPMKMANRSAFCCVRAGWRKGEEKGKATLLSLFPLLSSSLLTGAQALHRQAGNICQQQQDRKRQVGS